MTERRIIGPGDHATRVVHDAGFARLETVWDHPDNAELKQRRDNPSVLARGDELALPELRTATAEASTGARHRYVVRRTPLELRLQLRDFRQRPLAGRSCTLDVDGDAQELVSDGDGVIVRAIAHDARTAVLTVDDDELQLMIGYLEPVDTDAGWKDRLTNLGYLVDPQDEIAIELALEEFQTDNALELTRVPDDATRAKLLEIHGS
jgi:hypothetical protein